MSPWEQPQSEVCPVLVPPLTARLASRLRLKAGKTSLCCRALADPSGRLEPKRGLSGSEAYGCPPGTAAKRGLPGFGPPLTARLASRAVEGCVLKLICLVARGQNEVYPDDGVPNLASLKHVRTVSRCQKKYSYHFPSEKRGLPGVLLQGSKVLCKTRFIRFRPCALTHGYEANAETRGWRSRSAPI